MSRFQDFNAENKLRIPLSSYAAQIIENDCLVFNRKKTTLLNTIILNYYAYADCSISLRIIDFNRSISEYLGKLKSKNNDIFVDELISGKEKELCNKFSKRIIADVNWQITLNKKVKELLTNDTYTMEEKYYGNKPGRYIRALIEEYALLPFYRREEIVFSNFINSIETAINGAYAISLTNSKEHVFFVKPYKIESDPLSMYHYLIGYTINNTEQENKPISIRISRLKSVELTYLHDGKITSSEEKQLASELKNKGVQFISGSNSLIKVWLSDNGIKQYNTQFHLRPAYYMIDSENEHIYYFECTQTQILYYFIRFGEDAIVLEPKELSNKFIKFYTSTINEYKKWDT